MPQYDLFNNIIPENQLEGIRICLNGTFAMETKEMNKRLKAAGVTMIDRVSATREYKEGETIPPAKEGTCLYVVGTNPNEESIKRYELNKHDGYEAMMINEQQLMDLLAMQSDIDVPKKVEKKLNLTIDYYRWTAPTINDKVFASRVSSPVEYDPDGMVNTISRREIYVPDCEGVNMDALRQVIGNMGAYANCEYYDETDIVMLSDSTLQKLELGIKDDVIRGIEKRYNEGDAKTFNVQFTSESDFLAWVKARQARINDTATQALLDVLSK